MLLQPVDKHLEKIFRRKNAAWLAFLVRSSKFVGCIQQLVRQERTHSPGYALGMAEKNRGEGMALCF